MYPLFFPYSYLFNCLNQVSWGSSVLKNNSTYCFLTSIAKLIKIQLVDLIFLSFYELKQESRQFYADAQPLVVYEHNLYPILPDDVLFLLLSFIV